MRKVGAVIFMVFCFLMFKSCIPSTLACIIGTIILGGIYLSWKRSYAIVGMIFMSGIGYYMISVMEKRGGNIKDIAFGDYIYNFLILAVIFGIFIFIIGIVFNDHKVREERKMQNYRDDVIGCPRCGSRAVHYIEIEGVWKCTKCDHAWRDGYHGFF